MIHLGDIKQISGFNAPAVDCVIGGSPCQGLSVAGTQNGLKDVRSGLFLEQIRIVKEMREKDKANGAKHIRPRFMLWENVPGAFSTNKGADFKTVLDEIIKIADPTAPGIPLPKKWPLADCYSGDGWSIAYRVFDAQFWGVPQRRRRIALVADFGGFAAPEILFIRKGLCGDFGQSAAQGQADTPGIGSGANTTSGDQPIGQASGFIWKQGEKGKGIGYQENVSPTLVQENVPGVLVEPTVYCIQGNCIDRADTAGCNGKGWTKDVSYTLNTIDRPAVTAVHITQDPITSEDKTPCLSAGNSNGGQCSVAVFENHGQDSRLTGPLDTAPTVAQKFGTGGNNTPLVMATGQANAEINSDLCPTLSCNHEAPILAAPPLGIGRDLICGGKDAHYGVKVETDLQPALTAQGPGAVLTLESNPIGIGRDAFNQGKNAQFGITIEENIQPTLTAMGPGAVASNATVRRLTPLECERLQGYPDGWTDIGDWVDSKGKLHKGSSDTARYKALGNSIALPPWKWIIKRLCAIYERPATMASLFDGIGGFPLIWETLNGKGSALWASEIEEFPMAVTKRHFTE